MATFSPQSLRWPADRAVLFVHGVGNAQPGDYAPLVQQVESILGESAAKYAMYFLYYDQVNDWFAQKEQAALAFSRLVQALRLATDGTALGTVAASFGGDVIWPVLLADGRLAVRAALLQQLQQIRLDGDACGYPPFFQHVSIIAHSMGCFHVYEALTYAAATPGSGLGPASGGGTFDNVILMASPVQLIRTVGQALGGAIPQPASIASVSQAALAIPAQAGAAGAAGPAVPITNNFVSITGNLDPVGGWFFRHPYAYMEVPGQRSYVDQQQVATVDGDERLSLAALLQSALQNGGPPKITPVNPHDWSAYVANNATLLRELLG